MYHNSYSKEVIVHMLSILWSEVKRKEKEKEKKDHTPLTNHTSISLNIKLKTCSFFDFFLLWKTTTWTSAIHMHYKQLQSKCQEKINNIVAQHKKWKLSSFQFHHANITSIPWLIRLQSQNLMLSVLHLLLLLSF